jgi:hypothetical protein
MSRTARTLQQEPHARPGPARRAELAGVGQYQSKEEDRMDTQDVSLAFAQCKASHNSQARNETLAGQLDWDPQKPWQSGCRCLELDVMQSETSYAWSVQHDGAYDPRPEKQLQAYFCQVLDWASVHPGHEPIIVYLDLKNAPLGDDEFPAAIDHVATSVFRDRLYLPGALMGDAPDLVAGAQKHGWPTLSALRDRIIVAFTGSDQGEVGRRRAYYAQTRPRDNVYFVDHRAGEGDPGAGDPEYPSTEHGDRVLLNLHIYTGRKPWQSYGRYFASQPGFLTRGYEANGEQLWNEALDSGLLNLIATNKIRNHEWAKVGETPYRAIPRVAVEAAPEAPAETAAAGNGRGR